VFWADLLSIGMKTLIFISKGKLPLRLLLCTNKDSVALLLEEKLSAQQTDKVD
jgi:hypothetical protein